MYMPTIFPIGVKEFETKFRTNLLEAHFRLD